VGLRAYIDWVFNVKYQGILSTWALLQQAHYNHTTATSVRDRTLVICYEDLTSPEDGAKTIQKIFEHLTLAYGYQAQVAEYSGDHATSHNVTILQQLTDIIAEIDEEYYNGDIAWLDSVLPC